MALVVLCHLGSARAQETEPFDPAQASQRDLEQLETALNDPASRQDQRDEAARRLVARQNSAGRNVLRQAMERENNRPAALAVARALAGDPNPSEEFIRPLFGLLSADRIWSDAAATALSNYKNNRMVIEGLIARATDRAAPPATRVAAARALGSFPEHRVARVLAEGLLLKGEEPAGVRDAAADALVDLTGLREMGRDPQRWRQWWASVANLTEGQFQASIAVSRTRHLEQIQQRHNQLVQEMQALLTRHYRASANGQDLLLELMRGNDPSLRVLGARLVKEDFLINQPPRPPTREQMRRMVGDSSADVRLEVARTLSYVNDREAVEAILTQLAQEPHAEIRAVLAEVLGRSLNLRATDTLADLLRDPSPAVAESAARALRQLGPILREKDPPLAESVAEDLRVALIGRTAVGSNGLREALIDAISVLRNPRSLQWLAPMLRGTEAPAVRRAVLRAFGELADRRAEDLILNALDDPDPAVRLEAVQALATTATWASAEALYRRLNSRDEPEALRNAAWQVLTSLFPQAPKEQLRDWPDRFRPRREGDPDARMMAERRFIVLKALAEKYQKSGEMDRWAYAQENIGTALMEQDRPADAAIYFRNALDHWVSQRDAPQMVTQGLIRHNLQALLEGRKYSDAVQFSAEMLTRQLTDQQTIGPLITAEANRLVRTVGDVDAAWSLIQEARKMAPPLNERYLQPLLDIEAQIKDKRTPSPG